MPPIARVGLLAPFEGLHRRAGYAALDAVRRVLADAPAPPGLIPLALDTSLDAPRAAQKLLATSGLIAVVGPILPTDGFAAAPVLGAQAEGAQRWTAPYALTEAGFVRPDDPAWALALVQATAGFAQQQGAARLAVAGWPEQAPALEPLAREGFAPLPAIQLLSPDALRPDDALLWLGSAPDGARFVAAARARLPELPLWLGSWLAADPVLVEHLHAAAVPLDSIFAVGWRREADAPDAAERPGAAFTDTLLEQATRAALTGAPAGASAWRPAAYRLQAAGGAVEWLLEAEG